MNPYREDPEKIDNNFLWSEVWDIVKGTELLMLATFYSLNSVCVV